MNAPKTIQYHQHQKTLNVDFENISYKLPAEYLRVFSPSAEVRQHGGPMQLVSGKSDVQIINIEPVGHYAVKIDFDDGHDSGLYTWSTLKELGENYEKNWTDYLKKLEDAGLKRKPSNALFKKA